MTSREPFDETDAVLAPATPGARALPTQAADDDESSDSAPADDD